MFPLSFVLRDERDGVMRKCVAEFIGTAVLVFVGCGTASVLGCNADLGVGYLSTALAFGLVIVAMAYSIGNVSGCHINPAVSLAMLLSGRMKARECIGYVASQCVGALFGAFLLALFVPAESGLGANAWYMEDACLSVLMEIVLTFVFVMSVLGATDREEYRPTAGLVIGLSLVLVHLVGIAFTGTSVNPARSIGPAVLAGGRALCQLWVFIVGPLVGGVLASFCYGFLNKKETTDDGKGGSFPENVTYK